jgi:hypothetical protein
MGFGKPLTRDQLFQQIAEATPTNRGDQMRLGKYVFALKKAMINQGFKGLHFIIELLVKEAQAKRADVQPNAVGSTVALVFKLEGEFMQVALNNIKSFVLALLGEPDTAENQAQVKEVLNELTSDDQPLRGMLIACEAFEAEKQKKKGETYIGQNWAHVPNQTGESIAASRAELDGLKPPSF